MTATVSAGLLFVGLMQGEDRVDLLPGNARLQSVVELHCPFGGWDPSVDRAWLDNVPLEESAVTADMRELPRMYYTDESHGRPFAKDPDVAWFQGRYLMYYSIRQADGRIAIGIAESKDLDHWSKVCEILGDAPYESKGLAAPAAMVRQGKLHLFYQTYGNGRNDAICHATSEDGLHFARNPTNPIFHPTGDWTCGRAIDADVIEYDGQLILYCATRDPAMEVQKLVVAAAPADSDWGRDQWRQLCERSILEPQLPWEKRCIEAPSVCRHKSRLYMFYAGGYNNQPQQIGCAVSDDGVSWSRLSQHPLLPNGNEGDWNSSESGHPGVFEDRDGRMHLFFQGNDDRGASWHLSRMEIGWDDSDRPYLIRPRDGRVFNLR